jgi:hypothetical protein
VHPGDRPAHANPLAAPLAHSVLYYRVMKKTTRRPKKLTIDKKAITKITVKGLKMTSGGCEPGAHVKNQMP